MEISDNLLLNISIGICFIGITTLFLLSYLEKIPTSSSILNDETNKKITITGIITKTWPSSTNTTTFAQIEHTCNTKLVIFDNQQVPINKTVRIEGKVQEYNGNKEIIVDRIY
jgi:hypothetical protein